VTELVVDLLLLGVLVVPALGKRRRLAFLEHFVVKRLLLFLLLIVALLVRVVFRTLSKFYVLTLFRLFNKLRALP